MRKLSNEETKALIKKIDTLSSEELIEEIQRNYKDTYLTATILGQIFEKISNVQDGYGRLWEMSDLVNIHKNFKTTNGGDWNRQDVSYLGKKYKIKKEYSHNSISALKLDGENLDITQTKKNISPNIKRALKNERCAVLDVGTNLEIDHKNGQYNSRDNENLNTQRVEDFQVFSKSANDAKRQHCKICRQTNKRYDATRLGYSESFILGDADSPNCKGCYWYDPKAFNKEISKDYKKTR